MAITNLATLRDAVRSMADRSDAVLSDELIDTLLSLAETKIYRRLRTPANEAADEFTATSADNALVISPNFIEFRIVAHNNKALEQFSMREFYNGNEGFARFGGRIFFNPGFNEGDVINLFYYHDLSGTLANANDTNDVLAASPNVYLYGILAEAFRDSQEPEMAVMYDGLCDGEITNMNSMARHAELSGGKLSIGPSAYTNNISNKYTVYGG